MADSELWTVPEVAAYLKVSEGHIYRLTSGNAIPFVRVGGLRFRKADIDAWLDTRRIEAVQ